ncbi:MAG: hypothetical protein ACI85S_002942, partial [Pseudohongiellaceae bacterium]
GVLGTRKTRVSASSLIVQIPKSGGVGAPPKKPPASLKTSIAFLPAQR